MPPSIAPDNLESFTAAFFQSTGSALTTLLNRQVTVEVAGVTPVSSRDLPAQVPAPWIVVRIDYHRGMTGTHWILFPRASALAFAHAVLGEDSSDDDELRPEHEDAIREVVNQMLSATGPTLAPLLMRSISFAPVTLAAVDGVADLPDDLGVEHVWLVQVRARGGEGFRAEWGLLVPDEFVSELRTIGGAPVAAIAEVAPPSKLDLILDVTLPVSVELGRARMQIQDILKLAPGSVIELDRSAGDPVELFINDRPIAKGEVVVIDENFGVRLTSIVTATERIKTLR
jgi:flagellar motor switch protein FliN/FliY